MTHALPAGVAIAGPPVDRADEVLTAEALGLVADLHCRFDAQRLARLTARVTVQARLDAGETLDFADETRAVRDGDWQVAPAPADLRRRPVEITGPTDRKMVINALNSGASGFMADFEDANSPTWANMVDGQANLVDAIERTIAFEGPDGRRYALTGEPATLLVRPRGWHLVEKHLTVDGQPVSASLFDVGLFLAHCGRRLLDRGSGPYLYLPKLESPLEARLWHDVLSHAELELGLPTASTRTTVLIETLPAAFAMEEILYELRDRSPALNAGRWDYLFSAIKKLRGRPDLVLGDRNAVTMTAPFMRAYTELLVTTCHRRGAHAMGGMAAFVPSRRDAEVNETAMAKVRADKEREAADGFDGTWVAHPDLVPLATEILSAAIGETGHQLARRRERVDVSAADLLALDRDAAPATEAGLRNDVSVGLQYLEAWLRGQGAVAIFGLMEDAATAEIARSQVWQWRHHGTVLDTGEPVTAELVERIVDEELGRLDTTTDGNRFADARRLFTDLALADEIAEFLTVPAYELLP